ncbi:unnamed protein product [Pedinophyceae sp. YPF-701]|nr:unnamed protein product [Pedinophyceae sp. YPF-701]
MHGAGGRVGCRAGVQQRRVRDVRVYAGDFEEEAEKAFREWSGSALYSPEMQETMMGMQKEFRMMSQMVEGFPRYDPAGKKMAVAEMRKIADRFDNVITRLRLLAMEDKGAAKIKASLDSLLNNTPFTASESMEEIFSEVEQLVEKEALLPPGDATAKQYAAKQEMLLEPFKRSNPSMVSPEMMEEVVMEVARTDPSLATVMMDPEFLKKAVMCMVEPQVRVRYADDPQVMKMVEIWDRVKARKGGGA